MINSPSYSEQELVHSLKQRDEQAFAYLYDHYSAAIHGLLQQFIQDPEQVNDVLQDVFVNIWRKIDQYDPGKGRLFTWMYNIARNMAIDTIRSKSFRQQQSNRELKEGVDEQQQDLQQMPVRDDIGLRRVISKLSQDHRQLIELSYYQGYTQDEISRMLGIPLGTVKTRIRAALTVLRKELST